jgi:hypothetical protein
MLVITEVTGETKGLRLWAASAAVPLSATAVMVTAQLPQVVWVR